MSDKFRILLVSRPAAGGMKVHLVRLVRGLSDRFDFALAAPESLANEAGVEGYVLDVPDRLSPFKLPVLVMKLVRIIRRAKPRLLHAHGYVAGTVTAMAGSLVGLPRILCTLHNLFPPNASPVAKRALQISGRSCAKLIAVSKAVKASVVAAGVPAEKVVVIPNGIDLEPFSCPMDRNAARSKLGIAPDAPLIFTASRLIPAKGIDILLAAADKLRQSFPHIRVLIAGDGPLRAELENISAKMGLDQVVSYLGERDDIPDLLAASDVAVVPSLLEGQSLFVLEAMAARKPVIASNVGGMAEMIHDGMTGLLVPLADPVALNQAVGLVLRDRELADRLSENGRQFVETEMTSDKMLQKIRDLYLELGS